MKGNNLIAKSIITIIPDPFKKYEKSFFDSSSIFKIC